MRLVLVAGERADWVFQCALRATRWMGDRNRLGEPLSLRSRRLGRRRIRGAGSPLTDPPVLVNGFVARRDDLHLSGAWEARLDLEYDQDRPSTSAIGSLGRGLRAGRFEALASEEIRTSSPDQPSLSTMARRARRFDTQIQLLEQLQGDDNSLDRRITMSQGGNAQDEEG